MKGIYLGAYRALHTRFDIDYQDINGERDIGGDMLEIDLTKYDYIICTPPCNYWSRANYRRELSEYSQKTKHLLPSMLKKLIQLNKPFIVENVRNCNMFCKYGLFDFPGVYVYFIGRHTYWTNCPIDTITVNILNQIQKPLVVSENGKKKYLSSQNLPRDKRQGGKEVYQVIDTWLTIWVRPL